MDTSPATGPENSRLAFWSLPQRCHQVVGFSGAMVADLKVSGSVGIKANGTWGIPISTTNKGHWREELQDSTCLRKAARDLLKLIFPSKIGRQ